MRDEVFNDCLEHWKESGSGKPYWDMLAEKWGYESGEKLRGSFKHARKMKGIKGKNTDYSGDEFHDTSVKNIDGTYFSDKLIEISEKQLKDENYLLEAHGFDPKKWVLAWAKSNLWHGPTKDGQQTMYQSKITVRPKTIEDISLDDILSMFSKKNSISTLVLPKIEYEIHLFFA